MHDFSPARGPAGGARSSGNPAEPLAAPAAVRVRVWRAVPCAAAAAAAADAADAALRARAFRCLLARSKK